MKSNLLFSFVAALTLVAGASTAIAADTFHAEVGGSGLEHFQSTKTRAEVTAEAIRARELGQIPTGEGGYPVLQAGTSQRTRAEVMKEYHDYVQSGQQAKDAALLAP